jgi:Protein of unknown function (DUF1264)
MRRRDMLGLLVATAAAQSLEHEAKADDHPMESPLGNVHLQLCAFHISKKNPTFQVQAQHYCAQVNDDLFQCIIYESNAKTARLLGVEYIITDRLYRTLPTDEKKYYHPHTYEVMSGLLVALGMSEAEEEKLMGQVLTTWGKTWHTWPDPKSALPMGEPLLMWAHTKDGQIDPALLAARDRTYGVSTSEKRRKRASLGPVPQVDPPRSLETLGRQWTNDGPDVPPTK